MLSVDSPETWIQKHRLCEHVSCEIFSWLPINRATMRVDRWQFLIRLCQLVFPWIYFVITGIHLVEISQSNQAIMTAVMLAAINCLVIRDRIRIRIWMHRLFWPWNVVYLVMETIISSSAKRWIHWWLAWISVVVRGSQSSKLWLPSTFCN